MSRVKAKDLRALSKTELDSKKEGLVKELHDLRQKKVIGQLEKPHQFKVARKQIAQINTIQAEQKKKA